LDSKLKTAEAERQRLTTTLKATKSERQQLDSKLKTAEAERQRLDTALNAAQSEHLQLESALDSSRQSQTEIELRIHVLENEAASLRSETRRWWLEADHWWHEADHHWSALQAVYASNSWRLTAPMRALHIKNIKKLVSAVFVLTRKISVISLLFHLTKYRFPKLWHTVATWVNGPAPASSVAAIPVQLIETVLLAREGEQHFLDLFQRELSWRAAQKTEAQQ